MYVRKSRENYRQMYGKSKADLWRNLSIGTPPKFFRTILCTFVYNWYFFRTAVLRKLSDIRFSYKHCNFTRLSTRQDGIENRDNVYSKNNLRLVRPPAWLTQTLLLTQRLVCEFESKHCFFRVAAGKNVRDQGSLKKWSESLNKCEKSGKKAKYAVSCGGGQAAWKCFETEYIVTCLTPRLLHRNFLKGLVQFYPTKLVNTQNNRVCAKR